MHWIIKYCGKNAVTLRRTSIWLLDSLNKHIAVISCITSQSEKLKQSVLKLTDILIKGCEEFIGTKRIRSILGQSELEVMEHYGTTDIDFVY